MEEDNIIGTCLVPFFNGKDGRNFVVLKKGKNGIGFLGGLVKKGESAPAALAKQIENSIFILPDLESGTDFYKVPILEDGEIILDLNNKDEGEPDLHYDILSYLGSYWNTAKQVFNPEDKGIADWIIAYAFVAEMEEDIDEDMIRSWLGEDANECIILEVKDKEKPELSDNYQVEIYNDALRYLKDCLNASYGIIS